MKKPRQRKESPEDPLQATGRILFRMKRGSSLHPEAKASLRVAKFCLGERNTVAFLRLVPRINSIGLPIATHFSVVSTSWDA